MMTTSSILIMGICLLVAVFLLVFFIRLARRKSAGESIHVNEQIYVGNLPYRANEQDLRQYFSDFGKLESVRIIRNFKTGDSKGYAFVTYKTPREANAALVANGREMQGRAMVVRIAKPRQADF